MWQESASHLHRPQRKKLQPPRLYQVTQSEQLTPHMQRIYLTGETSHLDPQIHFGAHVKLLWPKNEQAVSKANNPMSNLLDLHAHPLMIKRSYSLRQIDLAHNEIVIDFVLHDQYGPACTWAREAQAGDTLIIQGPMAPLPIYTQADFLLLAGDMSALPAIAAILEHLPQDAKGVVFLEIADERDRQVLIHPPAIHVQWLLNDETITGSTLLSAIQTLVIPTAEKMSAWIAGENSSVIAIRDFLRQQLQINKTQLYAVPYWKRMFNEESYHALRHEVMAQ